MQKVLEGLSSGVEIPPVTCESTQQVPEQFSHVTRLVVYAKSVTKKFGGNRFSLLVRLSKRRNE